MNATSTPSATKDIATPRTDAALLKFTINTGSFNVPVDDMPEVVKADFARQLERELATATRLFEEANRHAAELATRSSERDSIPLSILRQHWLHAIECDHERKMDRPICACSTVDLGWHASVGAAVEVWLMHLQGVSPAIRSLRPTTAASGEWITCPDTGKQCNDFCDPGKGDRCAKTGLAFSSTVEKPVAYIEHHKGGDNLVWDDPGGKRTPLYRAPVSAIEDTTK